MTDFSVPLFHIFTDCFGTEMQNCGCRAISRQTLGKRVALFGISRYLDTVFTFRVCASKSMYTRKQVSCCPRENMVLSLIISVSATSVSLLVLAKISLLAIIKY